MLSSIQLKRIKILTEIQANAAHCLYKLVKSNYEMTWILVMLGMIHQFSQNTSIGSTILLARCLRKTHDKNNNTAELLS